jgi:hypothetical protein
MVCVHLEVLWEVQYIECGGSGFGGNPNSILRKRVEGGAIY